MSSKPVFSPAVEAELDALAARYPQKRSALIPMLIVAQREHGWVRPDAIEHVARTLDLSPSDVDSVVSFYTLLHRRPVGRNVLLVCTNLSCMLTGSDRIAETLRNRLGAEWGETTGDGLFTLVEAECLGSCTTAPVLQANGVFHENLTIEKVEALLEQLREKAAGAPPDNGSRPDTEPPAAS
jgi:NADH-quinone oxidoreductase E subunit